MHCFRCRDVLLRLTAHEWQLVEQLAQGKSNDEMARDCGLKIKTVRNLLSGIYQKMHLLDRLQVVVFVYQHRMIAIGDVPLDDPYGREEAQRQAQEDSR